MVSAGAGITVITEVVVWCVDTADFGVTGIGSADTVIIAINQTCGLALLVFAVVSIGTGIAIVTE